MNCKPGNLAMIVRSHAGNEGKIVRCLKFLGKVPDYLGEDRWLVSEELMDSTGKVVKHHNDEFMRPIRDQEGEDEILRIAGKPRKETVK